MKCRTKKLSVCQKNVAAFSCCSKVLWKQYCRINGVDSNINNTNVGIPQGSCLGQLRFLVYINDLPFIVKSSKVSMYAYDTSIYHSSKDNTQLNMDLNEELRRLDKWLKGNKLYLNVAKTPSMLITTKQKKKCLKASNQALQPSIREENIEVVCNTKYLGVHIDEIQSLRKLLVQLDF